MTPPAPGSTPDATSSYDTVALKVTLDEIRAAVERVTGLLLATRDGLILCSDTRDIEDDSVAAMAAAAAGLSARFTAQAQVGTPRATMFEGETGYVCLFPVDSSLLLVVFGERDLTMGLFNIAAKQALSQLQQSLDRQSRA
jgi:predicted regulator of Ras-like GTPase activity (Roadblock/LC7/MglB family)